jgi:hypothetical protein
MESGVWAIKRAPFGALYYSNLISRYLYHLNFLHEAISTCNTKPPFMGGFEKIIRLKE